MHMIRTVTATLLSWGPGAWGPLVGGVWNCETSGERNDHSLSEYETSTVEGNTGRG